ncbi:hypothetical protein CHARACLAT_015701, partial [Characodon lateralis]|nr:hypothetical protein [Characodon lateralis]
QRTKNAHNPLSGASSAHTAVPTSQILPSIPALKDTPPFEGYGTFSNQSRALAFDPDSDWADFSKAAQ